MERETGADRDASTTHSPELRREVLLPVSSHRRPSSLLGLSLMLILMASAVDAVVWSYHAKRAAEQELLRERIMQPMSRSQAAQQPELQIDGDVVRAVEPATIGPAPAIIAPVEAEHIPPYKATAPMPNAATDCADGADPLCCL